MPSDLAIRLTYHDKLITELLSGTNSFLNTLFNNCESMFAVCHNYLNYGDKPRQHIHIAVKGFYFSHDTARKKIKDWYNIRHDHVIQSSDLSVKKWDLGDKYLIYMIKGQPEEIHPILVNRKPDPESPAGMTYNAWFSEEQIAKYRSAWREGVCPQAENYKLWMAHETFPKKPRVFNEYGELLGPPVVFDDIIKSATKFICSIHGEWITAKHRFAIKDLVSNYCIRNNIKMSNIYI